MAALTLLARRDFAVRELRERLAEDGFPADVLEPLVQDLLAQGALDDARYAASYTSYHAARGQGPRRITQDLMERGVAPVLIEAAIAAGPAGRVEAGDPPGGRGRDKVGEAGWKALAREVRAGRFGPEAPVDWPEKARQARFLQYRGFSSDHIRSALGPDFDPEDPS